MMTITCVNCGLANEADAKICARCGKPLAEPTTQLGQLLSLPISTQVQSGPPEKAPEPAAHFTKHFGKLGVNSIALYINNQPDPLMLDFTQQITLGRLVPNSGVQPNVDLTSYGAYEKGVSRVHATIRRTEKGLAVEDNGSSNGTWLEGERLKPYMQLPLTPGSHLWMGKLELVPYFLAETKQTTQLAMNADPASAAAHYQGSFTLDAKHIDADLSIVVHEVIDRLLALKNCDIRLTLNVDARTVEPFSQEIQRAINDSTEKLTLTKSETNP
jgi:pSer/pThr/pTyr-binding forkhead associated (FHA) protein